jgi:tetratricopeptide (TPR) repeat protein
VGVDGAFMHAHYLLQAAAQERRERVSGRTREQDETTYWDWKGREGLARGGVRCRVLRAHVFAMFCFQASRLYLEKRYDEALKEFTSAILLAPDSWTEKPKLLCNRAAALIMMHR